MTGRIMKSTKKQLENRGFINDDEVTKYSMNDTPSLLFMLNFGNQKERSIAARLLGDKKDYKAVEDLCNALKKEKALYTKIEIQNALVKSDIIAIPFLINQLGVIGKNQHKKINNDDLNKRTYPLARDIAARVLCQIGPKALPALKEVIKSGGYKQRLEAIDAIGHITYHYDNVACEEELMELYRSKDCDDLMQWKIIKAMQSFKSERMQTELKEIIEKGNDEILIKEAKRSMDRIEERKEWKSK